VFDLLLESELFLTLLALFNPNPKLISFYFTFFLVELLTWAVTDFLHKLSRKIVNENQVIVVENLAVKNMIENHNLAKAISDCGWGQFATMLKYKSEWEGKTYLEIDRWFPSSKTCNVCLNKVDSLSLEIRNWACNKCGTQHDRDVNAAINIRNEGLRILSLGTRDTANGGNVRQPGKTSVLLDAVPCEVGSQHSTL